MKTQAGREGQDAADRVTARIGKVRDGLAAVGKMHDDINDHLDWIESKIPTISGGKPLPLARPRSAGPDAAGNDRSSNAVYDSNYNKD